jgi:tellurite resistance protein
MEFLFFLLFIAVMIFGVGGVLRAGASTTKAVFKTDSSGGNIIDNFKEEIREMGPLEAQIVPAKITLGDKLVDVYEVKVRGLLNASYACDLVLVTSIFDFTSQKYEAILSSLDFFKEKQTEGFQNVVEVGRISPNQGYKNWVKVATLFPETLTATRSGDRIVRVMVRAMPETEVSKIEYGLHDEGTTIFSTAAISRLINFQEKGWLETIEEREEARVLMVKIAVSVASHEGSMNPSEGKVIQQWIKKQLESIRESDVDRIKAKLNDALKAAFADAEGGFLDREALISKLKAIDIKSLNRSLLEFLVDVIGADGEITASEMALVRSISEKLGFDYDEVKAMSDKAFLSMDVIPSVEESLEGLLGIDPSWSKEQILSHLRREFSKWNGRIQALEDPSEKDKAQRMLDAIAAARKKYGAN